MELIKLHRLENTYPCTYFIEDIFVNPSNILYVSKYITPSKKTSDNLESLFDEESFVVPLDNKDMEPTLIVLTNNYTLIVTESIDQINELLK